jgi:hypothetical protein
MSKLVGLLVGRENTFPSAFIETVNQRGAAQGVSAEMETGDQSSSGCRKDTFRF